MKPLHTLHLDDAKIGDFNLYLLSIYDGCDECGHKLDKALQWACYHGNIEAVQYLLLFDCDIYFSELCFHYTATFGHTNIAQLLLTDDRFLLSGDALVEACIEGHLEMVKLILKDGRIEPSYDSSRCLVEACKFGHKDVVCVLLEDGRVDVLEDDSKALYKASKYRHYEIVEILLEREAHVSPRWYSKMVMNSLMDHEFKIPNLLEDSVMSMMTMKRCMSE